MSKIVSIASTKGGSGKTTLAVCVGAHFAVEMGLKVALIDLDGPQFHAAKWIRRSAKLNEAIRVVTLKDIIRQKQKVWQALDKLRTQFDIVLIDVVGADSEPLNDGLVNADLVVIPAGDSTLDVDGIDMTVDRIRFLEEQHKISIPFVLALTKIMPHSVLRKIVIADIERAGYPRFESEVRYLQKLKESFVLGTAPAILGGGRKSGRMGLAYQDIRALTEELAKHLVSIPGAKEQTNVAA